MSTSAAASRYIPPDALREAAFLEESLPLQVFATLTLPHYAPRMALDTYFSQWTDSIQRHNRRTLGWIRAYENEPQPHIHAVLLASAPLDCDHAGMIWRKLIARRYPLAAVVEPYKFGIGGLGYVMKSLDRPSEQVQFSYNLSAFVPDSACLFFGRNCAERRHIRRVALQRADSG